MRSLIRAVAASATFAAAVPGAVAQTAASFDAKADPAARRAADSLELSPSQRDAFYANVDTAIAYGLAANPVAGRPAVDSVLALVVHETGRKMRFVRQARMLFSDMFARRANDRNRPRGTEEELWRSPANVANLIELYRDNPDASDHEMERAMAAAFRPPE
ncbi:MAG TPA: hypothetical protein VFM14_11345 [Gemmatimonadales bacterium]|nr:hypothetical protein [Gemmatimonadales bacterium]